MEGEVGSKLPKILPTWFVHAPYQVLYDHTKAVRMCGIFFCEFAIIYSHTETIWEGDLEFLFVFYFIFKLNYHHFNLIEFAGISNYQNNNSPETWGHRHTNEVGYGKN